MSSKSSKKLKKEVDANQVCITWTEEKKTI